MRRLFTNVWTILTLDCQGSAELTSESFDRRLSIAERIAVWLHCLICRKSRKLNRQMHLLDAKVNRIFVEDHPLLPLALSDDAKARIAKNLEEAGSR